MSEHSPLPWKAVPNGAEPHEPILQANDGSTVTALSYTYDGEDFLCPNAEANAAFIVRAANTHQMLVEACDAAESILRYSPQTSTNVNGTKPSMTTRCALELVRAALAKATTP